MSALPRPRATRARAAPCIELGDDSADFFGLVPRRPIAIKDKDLSDRAKVVLTALCILARGSRTWVRATIEEVALAAGHSARKARQGLAELTEQHLIKWESIGDRFRFLFRLRGQDDGPSAPAPRIAAGPDHAPEWVRDRVRDQVRDCVAEPAPLSTPISSNRETEKTTDEPGSSSSLDPSTVEELSRRAYRAIVGASPERIAEALASIGPEEFGGILGSAERLNRNPDPKKRVQGWGYVASGIKIVHAKRAAARIIDVPAPPSGPGPQPERSPAEVYREAEAARERRREAEQAAREERLRAAWDELSEAEREAIRAAVIAGQPAIRRWPKMAEAACLNELERRQSSPSAEKTPAAGSHSAKFPPPPGRELDDALPVPVSYREQEFTARQAGSSPLAHESPRESNPGESAGDSIEPPPGATGGGQGGASVPADGLHPASLSLAHRPDESRTPPAPARGGGEDRRPDRVGPPVESPPPAAGRAPGRPSDRVGRPEQSPAPGPRPAVVSACPKLVAAPAAHPDRGRASVPAGTAAIALPSVPIPESDHLGAGPQGIFRAAPDPHRRE